MPVGLLETFKGPIMNELQRQSQDKIMHDTLMQDWEKKGLMVFNRDG